MIEHVVMRKPGACRNHPKHVAAKPSNGAVRLERQCMDHEA